jgi:death on curing protein
LTRNHAFIDGNKRVGFHAMLVFLRLNGCQLAASEADAAVAMLALSSGDMSGAEFAEWVRVRVTAEPAAATRGF